MRDVTETFRAAVCYLIHGSLPQKLLTAVFIGSAALSLFFASFLVFYVLRAVMS
jgi:hypothetical protein